MFCSISGEAPQFPVVSKTTGHIYEKHLIESYLEENGKCPITEQNMTRDDLIPIQVNQAIKPRPPTATSIPSLLTIFQNEWDALMLETYTLKQHLDAMRQELSQALYQHDAACRVIARLIRERDEARAALSQAQSQLAQALSSSRVGEASVIDTIPAGVSQEALNKIVTLSKALSKQRKKRTIPESLASKEQIQSWTVASSHPLHKPSKPGILCLDINPNQPNIVATGGMDSAIFLFDRDAGRIVASSEEHSKRVTSILFHPKEDILFSTSYDHTARIWQPLEEGLNQLHAFRHPSEVIGSSIQATGDFIATASRDGYWSLFDVRAMQCLANVSAEASAGFTGIQFHPDGIILATGASDNKIRIWDMKTQQNVATFEHNGPITSIAFSENGYYMASGSEDRTVNLWDLRKLISFKTLDFDSVVRSVVFDYSGSYLAVGSDDIRTLFVKDWTPISVLDAHRDVVEAIKFGPDAQFLVSGSRDRTLKFWA